MTNDQSIAAIVKRHEQGLYRYLLVLGASSHEALDIAQDAFISLLRAARGQRFQEQSEQETASWLRLAGKRRLIDLRKRKGALPIDIETLDRAWQELTPDGDDAARLERLEDCRRSLPERSAEALSLRYDQQRTSDEIAQRLGSTRDAVRSLLSRARGLLRECMEKHGETS